MPRAFAATALFTSAVAAVFAPMFSSVRLFGLLTSRISQACTTTPSTRAGASAVQRMRFVIAASSEAHSGGERKATRDRHLPTVRRIQEIAIQTRLCGGAAIAPTIQRRLRIHSGELVIDPERQIARAEAELRAGEAEPVDEGCRHPVRERQLAPPHVVGRLDGIQAIDGRESLTTARPVDRRREACIRSAGGIAYRRFEPDTVRHVAADRRAGPPEFTREVVDDEVADLEFHRAGQLEITQETDRET